MMFPRLRALFRWRMYRSGRGHLISLDEAEAELLKRPEYRQAKSDALQRHDWTRLLEGRGANVDPENWGDPYLSEVQRWAREAGCRIVIETAPSTS